jgi:hypothetical protein
MSLALSSLLTKINVFSNINWPFEQRSWEGDRRAVRQRSTQRKQTLLGHRSNSEVALMHLLLFQRTNHTVLRRHDSSKGPIVDGSPRLLRHMVRATVSTLCLLLLPFAFAPNSSAEQAVSVGYGFGIWSGGGTGHIEGKLPYDYATFSYLYERPFKPQVAFVVEPYCNLISGPTDGVDIGFNVYVKAYLPEIRPRRQFYLTAGTGAAYTSIAFRQQGTHGLFVLQGALGYRHDRFFIEDRIHHYSNGNLAHPNRSVNSNIVKVGYYF